MARALQRLLENNQENDEDGVDQHAIVSVVEEVRELLNQTEPVEETSSPTVRLPRAIEILQQKKQRHVPPVETRASLASMQDDQEFSSSAEPVVEVASTPTHIDLSADDFSTMMGPQPPKKEKLSTHELRRRLGLVDQSTRARMAQASASEMVAREEQEAIQSDMMNLAKELKQRTQTINQSLVDDVKILDAVGQSAESNTTLLDRENAVLKKQLASAIGFWTSLYLVAVVVLVFIATYLYIKLFSRRRW
ncbi:Vesicle transport protein use1, partial [Globisporangium splendens]